MFGRPITAFFGLPLFFGLTARSRWESVSPGVCIGGWSPIVQQMFDDVPSGEFVWREEIAIEK